MRASVSSTSKDDSGMVTVETAISLTAAVLVLTALLLGLAAGNANAQLCHAVRAAARAHSLGADPRAAANSSLSSEVNIDVVQDGGWFTVVGSRDGLSLGAWQVGGLSCQVSGVAETSWVDLFSGGSS